MSRRWHNCKKLLITQSKARGEMRRVSKAIWGAVAAAVLSTTGVVITDLDWPAVAVAVIVQFFAIYFAPRNAETETGSVAGSGDA
jgi:hypothetical protein